MGIKKRPTTNFDDPVNYSAGEYNAVTPTLVDGDVVSFQFDSSGNLMVKTVNTGSGSNPAAGATASAVPADADYQGVNVGGNLTGVTGLSLGTKVAPTVAIVDASGNQITAFGGSGGNAAASNTGSAVPAAADYTGFNSGGNLVGVSSSNPLPVSLANTGANSTAVKVDNSGVTQPISAASLPLPTGAATAAKQPALGTAGSASADVISIQGVASMTAVKVDGSGVTQPVSGTVTANLSGSISNTGFNVTPATSGGTSAYHAVAAASNNAAAVKASAGQVYGWSIYNNATYPVYVKLYNKATAPAPATDNALLIRVIGVQSGTHVDHFNECGISGFSSGIGIAAVKGITDTDNTSLALSDCLIELDYK